MIDTFIADYGIRLDNAEAVSKMDSLDLARKLVRHQRAARRGGQPDHRR